MQLNKVYSIKTIDRVAVELGETVDQNFDLAIGMEPEDGIIWVYGPGDDSVIAFTPFGIENLQELIEMDRDRARDPPVAYAGCLQSGSPTPSASKGLRNLLSLRTFYKMPVYLR
jgi:hypothetical protein